ncbi:MAG: hypothetical protein U0X91_32475 [Spirosomataceae bacterium]
MNIKRYIAFSLLCLISFKTLVVPFVYLDFELRKEYIVRHLCENRFTPQLHCNGKCYLAKQLQKVARDHARTETEKLADNIKKSFSDVFEEWLFPEREAALTLTTVPTPTYYTASDGTELGFSFLHPPAAFFAF